MFQSLFKRLFPQIIKRKLQEKENLLETCFETPYQLNLSDLWSYTTLEILKRA